MTDKLIKIPDLDHPITIERNGARVVITAASRAIADSSNALTLREATYPPVLYIPRKDVDMAALKRTDYATYCPYKGECSYFSIVAAGSRGENAVWTIRSALRTPSEPSRITSPSTPTASTRSTSGRVRSNVDLPVKGAEMSTTSSEANKALVLEAFDTLFNKRDYATALTFWSPDYFQRSAHIAPGRDGLFDLVGAHRKPLRHEVGLVLAGR